MNRRPLAVAAASCDTISSTAKALILKVARVVNTKRPGDFTEMMREMEAAWDQLMHTLVPRFGS